MKINFIQSLKIIILTLALTVGADYLFAYTWTAPTAAPPGGNTGSPLNVTGQGQSKLGGLSLNTSGDAQNGLIVWSESATKGLVGIGVTPTRKLDVNGDLRLRGHIYDSANSAGAQGQVLTRGQNGIVWSTPAGGGTGGTGGTSGTSTTSGGITGSGTVNRVPVFQTATSLKDSSIVMGENNWIGIRTGTSPLAAALDINGGIRIQGGSPGVGKVLVSDATGVGSWQSLNASLYTPTIESTLSMANQAIICNLVPGRAYMVFIMGALLTQSNSVDYWVSISVNGTVGRIFIHNHPDGNAPVTLPIKAVANSSGCITASNPQNFYNQPVGPAEFQMLVSG